MAKRKKIKLLNVFDYYEPIQGWRTLLGDLQGWDQKAAISPCQERAIDHMMYQCMKMNPQSKL